MFETVMDGEKRRRGGARGRIRHSCRMETCGTGVQSLATVCISDCSDVIE